MNKSAFWSKLISDAVLKFDKVYEREIFDQQKRIFMNPEELKVCVFEWAIIGNFVRNSELILKKVS